MNAHPPLALRATAATAIAADERKRRMDRVKSQCVLRNHLAEAAIQPARMGGLSKVQRMLQVLKSPFHEPPGAAVAPAALPPAWSIPLEIPCSS